MIIQTMYLLWIIDRLFSFLRLISFASLTVLEETGEILKLSEIDSLLKCDYERMGNISTLDITSLQH